MCIDIPKVRGKMSEKGYTISSMAEHLDIDRNTLSSYLNEPEKIPYRVLSGLASALCEDVVEARNIFFAQDFHKM